MTIFSGRIANLFSHYGWSPERCVDIIPFVGELAEEGFQIFDIAERLLRNLHGLKIERDEGLHTSMSFHAGEGLGTLCDVQPWAEANNLNIYAIGMWPPHPMYIDEQGRLYITDFSVFERVGESIDEGLEKLLFFRGGQSFVLIPPILV